jgi:opacity protein-like surface antigen
MKKFITTAVLLFMVPALAAAQTADQSPRGQLYIFAGDATHQMGLTAGFGGEVYISHGLGVGLEAGTTGFNTSTNGNPNWIGLGSLDLSYHLFPRHSEHRLAPFVSGGYTNFFGQDTCSGLGGCLATDKYGPNYTNGYNVGGGTDFLMTRHLGLRLEVRYYGHGGRILWPSFPNDAQLNFVAFRIGLTFR